MSWLDRLFGRSRERQNSKRCAICGGSVVEGLAKQVYNWAVDPQDDLGRSYGGFCSECGNYYCWHCVYKYGEQLLRELNRPILPTRGTFDSATILDHRGMMYCPRCGDLRTRRTLVAT
jgi:uncharacterized protein with PIN domain